MHLARGLILNYVSKLHDGIAGTPGEYSQKSWVEVRGPLPKTLTVFKTNICDFPYPIYDLTKNSIPC